MSNDCTTLIKQLHDADPSLSLAGGLVDETKRLALAFHSFSFHFVRRTRNSLAHLLAKTRDSNACGDSELIC